jgi:hypothetical protein
MEIEYVNEIREYSIIDKENVIRSIEFLYL